MNFNTDGMRLTDCCGACSTYHGSTLCCKVCYREVDYGQGDGTEYRKGVQTPSTQIKVGDILNVNTGYRPLDDEDCEVLKISERMGLFGEAELVFHIKSYHGNHDYHVDPTKNVTKISVGKP